MKKTDKTLVTMLSLAFIQLIVVSIALANTPVSDVETIYQDTPIISKIDTIHHQDGIEIIIVGNKKLNYKTYNFSNPTRLAVDLNGFGVSNIPEKIDINSDKIASITCREYKNEKEILSRIELTIDEDASRDAKIELKGKKLAIFIPGVQNIGMETIESPYESVQDIFSSIESSTPDVDIPEPKSVTPEDLPFVRIAQSSAGTSKAGSLIEKTISSDEYDQETSMPIYEGIPISLDLKDADIVDIFLTISELTGYNVVIDPKVKGKINIRMNDVPWDQALDIILKQMELGKEYTGSKSPEFPKGNIIRIASVRQLKKEAEERRQLIDAQKVAEPLITKIVYLSYGQASKMQSIVKKMMSKRGQLIIDRRTNSMIITDIPANLTKIRNLVTLLDVRTKQILIAGKIITTKKDFTRTLGIEWGAGFVSDAIHGNTTGYRFPNHYNLDYAVSLPGGNPLISMTTGNVTDTFNLNAILSAGESEGLTKVISNPRVTTSDNESAEIKSGTQLAYIIESDRGTRYAFKDAVISLKVTPHVTNDNFIQLQVDAKKDSPDFTVYPPAIFTNRAKTEVLVRDGDTLVIGGLNQTTTGWESTRIPFLHRIPIIGMLFKNKSIKNEYDDLMIFITPKVIQQTKAEVQTVSFESSLIPDEDKKRGK